MSRHQDKYSSTRNAGFTLVEALVSLVLLTTALVPAFILATDALKLSTGIRNSLIAANLAQEGVEIVRAIRDTNWFAGVPFTTGLDTCGAGCLVVWNGSPPWPLPVGDTTPPLMWDKQSGLYQYVTGVVSPFSRKITIAPSSGSVVELVVQSEVTWVERSIPKTIVVEYHLYDWVQ